MLPWIALSCAAIGGIQDPAGVLTPIATIEVRGGPVVAASLEPAGGRLATLGVDGVVVVRDLQASRVIARSSKLPFPPAVLDAVALALVPSRSLVFAQSESEGLWRWDATRDVVERVEEVKRKVIAMVALPGGESLAILHGVGRDREVVFHSIDELGHLVPVDRSPSLGSNLDALTLRGSPPSLVVSGRESTTTSSARLDASSLAFERHEDGLLGVLSDGRRVRRIGLGSDASLSVGDEVQVWGAISGIAIAGNDVALIGPDVPNGIAVLDHEGARDLAPEESYRAVSGASDGTLVAVPDFGGVIVRRGGHVERILDHAGPPQELVFSPDGRFVAVVLPRAVLIADAATGAVRGAFPGACGVAAAATGAEFWIVDPVEAWRWHAPAGRRVGRAIPWPDGLSPMAVGDYGSVTPFAVAGDEVLYLELGRRIEGSALYRAEPTGVTRLDVDYGAGGDSWAAMLTRIGSMAYAPATHELVVHVARDAFFDFLGERSVQGALAVDTQSGRVRDVPGTEVCLSLTAAPDGLVFFGTTADQRVVRIEPARAAPARQSEPFEEVVLAGVTDGALVVIDGDAVAILDPADLTIRSWHTLPADTIDVDGHGAFARLSPQGDRLAVVVGNSVRLFRFGEAR